MPKWLGALEKRLKNKYNKQFFVGEKLSIADFAFTATIFSLIFNDANPTGAKFQEVFNNYHHLKHYQEKAAETFGDYLATRPKRPQ